MCVNYATQRRATRGSVRYVRPFVHLEHRDSQWKYCREITHLGVILLSVDTLQL